MVHLILVHFRRVFQSCAEWTQQLFDAVGGGKYVLAAFCVCLAIGLLFMPMRGRMSATSFVSDYQSYKRGQSKK